MSCLAKERLFVSHFSCEAKPYHFSLPLFLIETFRSSNVGQSLAHPTKADVLAHVTSGAHPSRSLAPVSEDGNMKDHNRKKV